VGGMRGKRERKEERKKERKRLACVERRKVIK
jgi:hypothetical protein